MTTQRSEVEAWLGDGHGLDDKQVTKLKQLADGITKRYPDDRGARETAWAVARELLVAETEAAETEVVRQLGIARLEARQAEQDALVGLQQAALQLVDSGENRKARGVRSKQGFAQYSGVARSRIQEWLGVLSPRRGSVRDWRRGAPPAPKGGDDV
jgi:hypothetical protein